MKYNFNRVFQENPNGTLSPRMNINVNGIMFSPGASFGPGVSFGGVDFHQYKYFDIEADEKEGILEIKGFYKQ